MAGGGRSRPKRRKAFGAIWPPGIMRTRGLASAAGAGATPPTTATSLLPVVPRLKPERAVSCFLRRGTRPPGNSSDNRRRLSVGFPAHLREHFPGRRAASCRRQGKRGGNKALPAGATPGTTLTRPLLPAVLQMCRTFQKSSVRGVVRPCPDSMPGTLLPESRSTMSLRATRASAEHRDAVDADLLDLTDRKGTQALEEMERGPAQARREGLA